ncbi:hypothetical protein NQZ79_g7022 [Umbelopsis isabellina]|nr:hypothetical protein NQZ79_g7022 [Umbelopsis isabellina]
MEAVPIHRSPSLSSASSSHFSSNTLDGNHIIQEPQRPPTALINRIKRLSFLTWLPSKDLDHPGNDLPIIDTSKTTLRRSRSKKKSVRQITKEWLLAALTIIMGGFIAGVFVITGIESAASSIRHKTTASNRWNGTTSISNSQAPPIPTDSSQLTDSTNVNGAQPLDPTQIPYAIEVLPDLTKLITCSNPTVVDAVAFVSNNISHRR